MSFNGCVLHCSNMHFHMRMLMIVYQCSDYEETKPQLASKLVTIQLYMCKKQNVTPSLCAWE